MASEERELWELMDAGKEGGSGNSGRDLGGILGVPGWGLGTTFDSQDPEFLEFPSAAPPEDQPLQAPFAGSCWDGKKAWEFLGMWGAGQ